jgi:predicted class III extradiol MEMO1 family dioxygenase
LGFDFEFKINILNKKLLKFVFDRMDIIETLEPVDFKDYLKKYDNTICGNHPISVFLNVRINFENI